MTDTIKIVVAGIAGGLVVLLLSVFLTAIKGEGTNLSGVYSIVEKTFDAGINTGSLVQGGGVLTISQTGAARTLTASEFANNSTVEIEAVALAAALTLTLPTAAQFGQFLTTDGDMKTIFIENNHTGAATTTTLAAGTNVDLLENDGQNVVLGINNTAEVTCWRKSDDTVGCKVNELIPAD